MVADFRILIVEDHVDFRTSLRDLLHTRLPGVLVDETGEGGEALAKIEDAPPHLVFMDIQLPGRNGLELTRCIKEVYPEIIVVMLTSHDMPEYRDAAFALGADYLFSKARTSGRNIVAFVKSILADRGLL